VAGALGPGHTGLIVFGCRLGGEEGRTLMACAAPGNPCQPTTGCPAQTVGVTVGSK
jgi:hypothetical protein